MAVLDGNQKCAAPTDARDASGTQNYSVEYYSPWRGNAIKGPKLSR